VSDVFLSYAREDRELAGELARALGTAGWSVWWDRKIIAGQAFDQAIEHELEAAKSVVVLWSRHSVASEWVKNEAAVASERGVLIPVLAEGVKPPLEFRRKQTADLIGWRGDTSHSGFQALCEGISATVGGARVHRPSRQERQTSHWDRRWAWVASAVTVVVLGLGAYSIDPWRSWEPPPGAQDHEPDVGTPGGQNPLDPGSGPADLVAGTYTGNIIADSQGPARSDVTLTITKRDKWTVHVTSDYARLGAVDVTLTRIENKILSTGGNTTLTLDLDKHPPRLDYAPDMKLAYVGTKQ